MEYFAKLIVPISGCDLVVLSLSWMKILEVEETKSGWLEKATKSLDVNTSLV